jgi:hypothetical protein
MSAWEITGEEAAIVFVGNFNPKIFHPEWFIRKGIVEEWSYESEEILHVPDMAKISLPSSRTLTVLLNKFSLVASNASDHLALKDFVSSTFSILAETPIVQMGMNFETKVKINNKDVWTQFSQKLVPHAPWAEVITYLDGLEEEKRESFGLLEVVMNLPRPDDLKGHIRPKIQATSLENQELSISINNHVDNESPDVEKMLEALEANWGNALDFAKEFTRNILET